MAFFPLEHLNSIFWAQIESICVLLIIRYVLLLPIVLNLLQFFLSFSSMVSFPVLKMSASLDYLPDSCSTFIIPSNLLSFPFQCKNNICTCTKSFCSCETNEDCSSPFQVLSRDLPFLFMENVAFYWPSFCSNRTLPIHSFFFHCKGKEETSLSWFFRLEKGFWPCWLKNTPHVSNY